MLELGCGTGRLTIPLEREGHDITGLDNSDRMLRRARSKPIAVGVDATWSEGDMRGIDLSRQFSLIFCPFGTFNHLHRDEVSECLASVREHLLPDGHFVLDTFNHCGSDHMPRSDVEGFSSFSRSEIEEFLLASGFDVMETFGDYDRSEYSESSKRLITKAAVA